jgi:hypothetical protein
MAEDRIEDVRSELVAIREYHQRYNGGRDFAFDETIARLVRAVEKLADEVEELRGGGEITGGGYQVFNPDAGPGFE